MFAQFIFETTNNLIRSDNTKEFIESERELIKRQGELGPSPALRKAVRSEIELMKIDEIL